MIVLFATTSLGNEESKDVEEAVERGIRDAKRRSRKGGRKPKKGSVRKGARPGGRKNKKKSKGKKKGNLSRKKGRKGNNPKKNYLKTRKSGKQGNFCPTEKATALKLLYNQVANFEKQLKRATSHAKIVKNKKSKKDNFAKDAAILTDVVGGNLTQPTCSAKGR